MGSDFMIDAGLYLSYAMFFVAFLAALAFPIWEIVTSMEAAKKALVSVGSAAVIFGLSYALSGNEVLPSYEKFGITPFLSQLIGGSLIMLYITSILTFVLLIVGEVVNFFR
ncbi:MAG: hypothetical protein RIT39_302 [Bacteroidota bacterium]|jgi:hypothetical protein